MIRERLKDDVVIVFDGGIGTYLYQKGVPKGLCYDELNVIMPEIVKEVHENYLRAGAEALTTNTFGANRFVLEEYFGIGKKAKEINYFGARLAKEVAKDKAFVAGSIGPISRPHDIKKALTPSEVEEIFAEQIEALAEGGVDLFIFETYNCFDELKIGIEVARRIAPEKPIIASVTFPNQLKTIFGEKPVELGKKLDASPADVIGVNCGSGPQEVFEAARILLSISKKPVSAMANAGQARFIHGKFVYPKNEDYFARYAEKMVAAGVKIVGGCCGTTPSHIRLIAERVKGKKVKRKEIIISLQEPEERRIEKRQVRTHLRSMLERKEVISVEIEPPKGPSITPLLEVLEKLRSAGFNTVNVSDSPMARVRMNPFALTKVIKEKIDFEVITHMTCRDRNLLGIQADLLGGNLLGVENILALTGDPPSVGDYPFATGVYDLDSLGLIEIISSLNSGYGYLGNPLGSATNYFVGSSLNVNAIDRGEIERAKRKIEAGARFLATQPVYDIDEFKRSLEKLRQLEVPIIVTIMPVVSWRNAEYLHYEVPGISLPEWLLKRMEGKKGKEGEREGVKIAREIFKGLQNEVEGILFIAPFEKYRLVEEILNG